VNNPASQPGRAACTPGPAADLAITGKLAGWAGAVVLVGCGARKTSHPATPAELYTGSYFRACLAAAVAIAPRDHVLILSACHGLLGLDDDPVEPYQLTLGQPGAVTADQVRAQAAERGIGGAPVVALCGARYAALAAQVWAQVATPLAGLGIGRQRHVLAILRAVAKHLAATPANRRRDPR
jgi:hypothetical protein